jgi:RHS repeat-associated protein
MDRVQTRTDPLLHTESYQYDQNGNLTQHTDRKSQVTTYAYDSLDRLSEITYADTSTVAHSYDAVSRLTQVTGSGSGTIAYSYDSLDRLLSETTPQGTISYTYDAFGRRATMSVPGESVTNYSYDNANRLTLISQGAMNVQFAYDAADRRVSLTLPNGVITEYGYNGASAPVGLTYKNETTTLGSLTYEYDLTGRRTRVAGSFARTNLPPVVASASYDSGNRQTSFNGQSMTYDLNGNLIGDGTNTYTWNVRDQLVSTAGGVAATFEYDALGRRRTKTIGGVTTSYLYDGYDVVKEQQGGGAVKILGGGLDQFFARTDGSGTASYISDALGSTVALTDSSGVVQTEYTYEPFGSSLVSGAASNNRSLYTAREEDGAGLYYYRNRYYSSNLHRFISEDPKEFGGGSLNLYEYVANSPINYTDPYGLEMLTASQYEQAAEGMRRSLAGRKLTIDDVQQALDFYGLVPGVGEAADLANAGISAARGNWCDAGLSVAGMIPLAGMAFTAGRIIRKSSRQIRRAWELENGIPWPKDPKTGWNMDVAHKDALADGGTNDLCNIKPMAHDAHMKEHMLNGDFVRWGKRRKLE